MQRTIFAIAMAAMAVAAPANTADKRLTCANVRCAAPNVCVEDPRPRCVPGRYDAPAPAALSARDPPPPRELCPQQNWCWPHEVCYLTASGHVCEPLPESKRDVPPPEEPAAERAGITCANVRCAFGPCKDTPKGPVCPPKPKPKGNGITCANVRCAFGPCKDTPSGPVCPPKPEDDLSKRAAAVPYIPCSSNKQCPANLECRREGRERVCLPKREPQGPKITCANVRCAFGPCVDTPTGPKCPPRPEPEGPVSTCANVKCAFGPCKDTPTGPVCPPRPEPESPGSTCANVKCAFGPCKDTPTGPVCPPQPEDGVAKRAAAVPVIPCTGEDEDECPANLVCGLEGGERVCTIPSRPSPASQVTCAVVLCAPDTRCVETATGPQCLAGTDVPEGK